MAGHEIPKAGTIWMQRKGDRRVVVITVHRDERGWLVEYQYTKATRPGGRVVFTDSRLESFHRRFERAPVRGER